MNAPQATVLYDAPGPKTKRRHLLYGVLGTLALAGLAIAAFQKLHAGGQFAAELWAPYFNPGNEYFKDVWTLLGESAVKTLVAAAFAITFSIAIGSALGVARMMLGKYTKLPIVGLIEVLRGLPVVIAIYFASRVLPGLGVTFENWPLTETFGDGLWFLVIGLTAYNSVVLAEILRAGVAALPKGQREAAAAIGLSNAQSMWLIQLPQATRIMLPALISQIVVILKDTSLAAVLGLYGELLQQGKLLASNLGNPLQTYFLIGVMFIVVNLLLSWLAHAVQQHTARAKVQ